MDWFLYDNGLRHERVKEIRLITQIRLELSHLREHKLSIISKIV